jgi:hypothetical protein
LRERDIERAKPRHVPRDRPVAAALVDALLLRRQLVGSVPDRVGQPHVLGEQEKHASEL